MKYILAKVNNEPVLVFALVQALIGLVSAFGFSLSADQTTALLIATSAVLAIVCRGRVTPTPMVPKGDERGAADAGLLLLVVAVIGIALLLFGIRF